MGNSRTDYVKKNIFYGYISTIVSSVCSIVVRTVFVYTLGVSYLGVSGLFANVLGVLSFTELGIGSAIGFALYKPIAEEDTEKIKSLLALYKKAYSLIAVIITVIGVGLIPFLQYLVNSEIPIADIRIYYAVFLFNTVSSYFITYKTAYVSALQKDYVCVNVSIICTVLMNAVQMIILLLGGDYLAYLLTAAIIGLLQRIVLACYLDRKFPLLTDKSIKPLDEETKKGIWKNVKALIIHKIGDVSVHQTDNIIISAFVSTAAVGVLSNYTTLNSLVATFTNKFFGSFTASFGNMVAKESVEKQRHVFDVYDLLGFWIYGFVLIAFVTLSNPFIELWLGKSLLLDNLTMVLYFISLYLTGMTIIPYNFKVAAGKFNEDKWVAFVQAITNLVVSILAIRVMGLPGVFVGTIVSRMIVVIIRPYIVYKYVLIENPAKYYIRLTLRSALAFFMCFVMWEIKRMVLPQVTILRFAVMCILTAVIPNGVFFALFHRSEAFHDILSRLKRT